MTVTNTAELFTFQPSDDILSYDDEYVLNADNEIRVQVCAIGGATTYLVNEDVTDENGEIEAVRHHGPLDGFPLLDQAMRRALNVKAERDIIALAVAKYDQTPLPAGLRPKGMPQCLNGWPVMDCAPKKGGGYVVIVARPGHGAHEWVVATWARQLGATWAWGHYFTSEGDARECWIDLID